MFWARLSWKLAIDHREDIIESQMAPASDVRMANFGLSYVSMNKMVNLSADCLYDVLRTTSWHPWN
jgi:hypothetical protein